MIPTMIVFGMAFGWWWKFTLIAAPLTWVTVLMAGGVIGWSMSPEMIVGTLLGGAALGLLNAAAGMVVPQAVRLTRFLIRRKRAAPADTVRY